MTTVLVDLYGAEFTVVGEFRPGVRASGQYDADPGHYDPGTPDEFTAHNVYLGDTDVMELLNEMSLCKENALSYIETLAAYEASRQYYFSDC
jgi:hypothetical protein